MKTKQYLVGALLLGFGWVLAAGCGASSGGLSGRDGDSKAGAPPSSSDEPTVFPPGVDDGDGGVPARLNPLCGGGALAGSCVPDYANACSSFVPPAPEPGTGGAGGDGSSNGGAGGAGGEAGQVNASGGAGGASGAAGAAPEAEGGQPGGGGASGGAPAQGGDSAGASAGAAGQAGEASGPPPRYSCQVTREDDQLVRRCVTAGTGAANAPCFGSSDCAAGLACVTEGDAGRCLPYCCANDGACQSGAYCAERSLRKSPTDVSGSEPPRVPVCVPADNCSLEERFPCASGGDCRCKNGTACLVVRSDGTTSCVKPGSGEQGDPCPCAWNHVCSSVTNECVKICHTDPKRDDCGAQKCQASSELPDHFGVCVGPSP